ncbi:DUF3265 domain-containing protein [Vibrio parahaemolyticus]|nr:DUF3265 domain-containing protein [Vibrio parahaemolyticus]
MVQERFGTAWHFHYALGSAVKVVCGGFCIALLTP